MAMEKDLPTFFVGAYGGASQAVVKALRGKKPVELTLKYQCEYKGYDDLFTYYNNHSPKSKIDYEEIRAYLKKSGKIKDFGLNNGLSRKENETLFEATDLSLIVRQILMGLHKTIGN